MSIEDGMKVTPGQFLGYIYDYEIGESGIFQKEDKLYSSLSGKLKLHKKKIKQYYQSSQIQIIIISHMETTKFTQK